MIKKYTISFTQVKPRSERCLIRREIWRDHFTKNDYDDVVSKLFEISGRGGIEYKWLTATIERDGKKIMTVKCDTEVDGSRIDSYISIARPREKYRWVRTMNLAS